MQARLITFSKSGQRKEFPVPNAPVVIGRQTDADLRIPLNEISRSHCQVSVSNGKLIIRDLKSSNGTFVNEQKIVEATLKAGDILRIGPVSFTVQIDGVPKNISPPAQQAAPAAKAAADARTATGASAPVKHGAPSKPVAEEDSDIDLGSGGADAIDIDDLSDLDIDDLQDTDESDEGLGADDLEEIDENDLIEDDDK